MSRIPYISVALRRRLTAMYCPGESIKTHKDETKHLRAEYKKKLILQGYSKGDANKLSLSICSYKNKIFSRSTLNCYFKAVDSFQQFCLETLGSKRISPEEASLHIQEFVNWNIEKGFTSQTIYTRLSGVCKALGLNISDYEKPKRHYTDVVRSTRPAKNDTYNSVRAKKALRANRIIGLRRAELCTLALKDIHFISDTCVEIHTIGKGKKHNINLISNPDEIAELKEMIEDAKRNGLEYLLSKDETRNDADLHHERAKKAISVYNSVCDDMAAHPERRAYYQNEILRVFAENGKTLRENLDSPYRCRGKNREKLEELGKPTVFDRVAVLYVSCTVTNHFRSDTTVQHYLIK